MDRLPWLFLSWLSSRSGGRLTSEFCHGLRDVLALTSAAQSTWRCLLQLLQVACARRGPASCERRKVNSASIVTHGHDEGLQSRPICQRFAVPDEDERRSRCLTERHRLFPGPYEHCKLNYWSQTIAIRFLLDASRRRTIAVSNPSLHHSFSACVEWRRHVTSTRQIPFLDNHLGSRTSISSERVRAAPNKARTPDL